MSAPLFPQTKLDAEFEKARRWITESRRKGNTRLVTSGHIIEPPFTVTQTNRDGYFDLTIEGSSGSVTIQCSEVIASRFRRGQLELLLFNEDHVLTQKRAIAALTENHWKILQAFPPGTSFTSEQLYAKVTTKSGESQRHARRRWKELKYNYGFDVDFDRQTNMYVRRPSNVPVKDPELRPDDALLRKDFLPALAEASRHNTGDSLPHCNRCGARVVFPNEGIEEIEYDDAGLLDHRRPIFQGGDDSIENLQIFCQTCNNKKNNVCRSCPYGFRCDTCHWAFPEKVSSRRLVLILNQELINKLRHRFGDDVEDRVSELIADIATRDEQ